MIYNPEYHDVVRSQRTGQLYIVERTDGVGDTKRAQCRNLQTRRLVWIFVSILEPVFNERAHDTFGGLEDDDDGDEPVET